MGLMDGVAWEKDHPICKCGGICDTCTPRSPIPVITAEQAVKTAQEEGRKHDDGKERWDLLPLGPIVYLVRVITFGAKKYAPNNWQKLADPFGRYYAAFMRHIVAYRQGDWADICPEHLGKRPDNCLKCSGLPHLAHALCNLVFLFWFELRARETKATVDHFAEALQHERDK